MSSSVIPCLRALARMTGSTWINISGRDSEGPVRLRLSLRCSPSRCPYTPRSQQAHAPLHPEHDVRDVIRRPDPLSLPSRGPLLAVSVLGIALRRAGGAQIAADSRAEPPVGVYGGDLIHLGPGRLVPRVPSTREVS